MNLRAGIPLRLLVAVALISAAALGYELLLMRLMAIIQWHHFAGMIISLALLGYGVSGTVLALLAPRAARDAERLFLINALLLAAAMPACFALAQAIPFNGLALVWEPRQLLWLTALYLTLAVPFLLAANCFGLLFCAWPASIGRVYGADLAGAGVGAVLVLALLWFLRPENLLPLLTGIVLVGVAVTTLARLRWLAGLSVLTAVLLIVLAPRATPWLALNITQFKNLPQRLAVMGAEVTHERWSPYGFLSVVQSPRVPFREAPGLSLTTRATVPEQIGVFIDGHALQTLTVLEDGVAFPEQMAFLNDSLSALPYWMLDEPSVFVTDAGTGERVLEALFHGASAVTAQELDPQLAGIAGDLYWSDHVRLRRGAVRQVLAGDTDRYDLMLISAGGGTAAAVHENYGFTVEAVRQYLRRLNDNGLLAVSVPLRYPPRDSLRVLTTVSAALEAEKTIDPGSHVLAIRNWDSALILVGKQAFSREAVDTARLFAQSKSFDRVWHAGIDSSEVNLFHRWSRPWLYDAATALFDGGGEAFIDGYKFDVRPARDDQPFFGQFFKAALIPDLRTLGPEGGALLLDAGYLIVAAALAQALVVSVLLIALPLWLVRRETGDAAGWPVLAYFGAIGLAFLFVEIGYLQKLTLVLGDPLLTAAAVLAGFLVFAGIGSLQSRALLEWALRRVPWPMLAVTVVVAGIVAVELLLLHLWAGTLLGAATPWRVTAALVLIAPLAFFMGVLFPAGLSRVADGAPGLIPWAWAINGCASVISALLAVLVSMHAGFTVIIGAGAILYLLAGLIFTRLPVPTHAR